MLDHHMMRFDDQAAANQCDSGIGRGLSGNREMRTAHDQRTARQIDHTADLEHHDPHG
jgi:hypothetical protein